MRKVIIFDIDNTLYNFVDFYGPCFRGMVHALARESKVAESDITNAFQKIYQQKNSLEYAFAVQELEIFKNLPEEELSKLVKIARGAYARVRQKLLKPYPGVKEGLEWLKKEGFYIVAYTDGTVFQSAMRLRQLRIDKYINGLIGWCGPALPDNQYTEKIHEKLQQGRYSSRIERVWELQKTALTAEQVLPYLADKLQTLPKQISLVTDQIYPSFDRLLNAGYQIIHAQYGQEVVQKNLDTINGLDKNFSFEQKGSKSTFETNVLLQFEELKGFLKPPQLKIPF